MKAPTLKMIFALLLAVCCCSVRGQNYPGASQYWSSQHQQQPQQQQQQQQQPQQFQQAFPNQQQRQQPQQQLAGHNPYRAQQLGFGQPNGQQGMQQQQPQQPGFQQQPQQPGFQQQQQPQQPGFQQGLQQQRQQPAFRQQFGSAAGDDSTRLRIGETTPSPFQNRLFSGASDSPSAGLGAPNGTGAPGSLGATGAPGAPGAPSASSAPGGALGQQDSNALELEPFGNVKQPQPGRPDSQVFQTPTDQALYAVDWSYPRARHAPASLVLKRWGGLSPPEYVAVYRLRGPTPSASSALHAADLAASPSYSLLRDEMRHYPWDAARRHGPPRWHGAPRDEDFELLPAGTPLGHHHGVDGHYGASQNYMFRTL